MLYNRDVIMLKGLHGNSGGTEYKFSPKVVKDILPHLKKY